MELMTCEFCDSSVTADEKYRELKNGSINRHVYYRCCKSRNQNCKNPAINENNLVKQITKVINEVGIKNLPMQEKIRSDVERIKKFHETILGEKAQVFLKDINTLAYATFILKEGSIDEKRGVMNCLKGQLTLMERKLFIL